MLQFAISLLPLSSRGYWDIPSLPVIYSGTLIIGTFWKASFWRRWDLPKRNKINLPTRDRTPVSCCENIHSWNGVFHFEKTLIRYAKEGERSWIRLKSAFNIWHLAVAPALTSQITAIDDACKCPLEREHRIPQIMIDSVTQVVFGEHVPIFICWLLGNHMPMAIF